MEFRPRTECQWLLGGRTHSRLHHTLLNTHLQSWRTRFTSRSLGAWVSLRTEGRSTTVETATICTLSCEPVGNHLRLVPVCLAAPLHLGHQTLPSGVPGEAMHGRSVKPCLVSGQRGNLPFSLAGLEHLVGHLVPQCPSSEQQRRIGQLQSLQKYCS